MKILKQITLILYLLLFNSEKSFAEDHGHSEGKEEHHEEEGVLRISDEMLEKFGVVKSTVETAILSNGIKVAGRIVPIDEKLSHVSPRFSGVVREVHAKVGQSVKPDEVLAVIQNNQNLQTFSVTAAIPGTVIRRHATLGESIGENSTLFVVADLSSVWAEFAVYKDDISKIKVGQKVLVSTAEDTSPHTGEIIFFSPITEERTQSRVARVLLSNPDFEFSPGAFVTGDIVTSQEKTELSVESNAIQQIEGSATVFTIHDSEIEPKKVVVGKSDDQITEILDGLQVGQTYLSGKTFILKAELGKSQAEHEH